jgi:hypothetical protein
MKLPSWAKSDLPEVCLVSTGLGERGRRRRNKNGVNVEKVKAEDY